MQGGKSSSGWWQQVPKSPMWATQPCVVRVPCWLILASSILLPSATVSELLWYIYFFPDLILLLLMMLWWTKTSRYFLPQDGHPRRHGTERKLACVVAVVSLCYQSCSQSQMGHSLSQSSSLWESCILGRSAESIKEKMWEGRDWAHRGGWDGRNTII